MTESPQAVYDYESLEGRIEIEAGGARTDQAIHVRTPDLERLRADLDRLDRAFSPGEVHHDPPWKNGLVLSISVRPIGSILVRGVATREGSVGPRWRFEFEFEVPDSLGAIHASVASLVRTFPSGASGESA